MVGSVGSNQDPGNNPCFENGLTWSTSGQIQFFPNIHTVSGCIELCFEAENCNGYTWHGKFNQKLENVCVLFESLIDEHDCSDCISGQFQG